MELKKNFKRVVLENGLTILFEKRDLPITSMCIAVKRGGMDESSEDKGIFHFIEHLLYKGTTSRSAFQIADEIEKRGGEINGFTDEELTAFWCKIPSKFSESGLEVLVDLVKNPSFPEEEIEKERNVIFEEIKLRKDNPRIYVVDSIKKMLYEPPFGEDISGSHETLSKINKEKIITKFKENYTPDNLVVCVVGDYDFEKLVEKMKSSFGNEKSLSSKNEIKIKNNSLTEKRKGVDQANLVFAYHSPLAGSKESYAAEVLMIIMAGGMSSRLFTEIREKRNLAYTVIGQVDSRRDYGHSLIYVGTKKESLSEVKKIILEEFKTVSESLLPEDLKKAKEQLIGNYELSMEDSQEQMVNLLLYESLNEATKFYDFEENVSNVTIEEVKELASRVKEGNYSYFELVPED